MLVLERRLKEVLLIGKDVRIQVVGIDARGTVKLGIEAPKNVVILREELGDGTSRRKRRSHNH